MKITFFKPKAKSRIVLSPLQKKWRRLKRSSSILCILLIVYVAQKLLLNIYVFHPVQSLANNDIEIVTVEKPVEVETPRENIDTYIGDAVDEFLPKHKSEARMIMHCLAHRENGHGANPNAHGDNGLAGGPFQFHQATWDRMRGQMMKKGLATEIGSRYDFKEAARTTAWAISNGNGLEWGPVLRDSKGSDFATCQTPSWY